MKNSTIALLDPQILFRKGLIELINKFEGYSVMIEADDEAELLKKISICGLPDLVMLEASMLLKTGYDTMLLLKKHHPPVKVIVLSCIHTHFAVMEMIQNGAFAFVSKSATPERLKKTMDKLLEPDFNSGGMPGLFYQKMLPDCFKHTHKIITIRFSDIEIQFMQLSCTNLTYLQMVGTLKMSLKCIDKMREKLFIKLDVKNRTELAVFTVDNGLRISTPAAASTLATMH